MNNTNFLDAAILDIALDRGDTQPLFDQLLQQLRQIILTGRMPAGSKLPSSRKFAIELSVSRVTVVTAYDQLLAEGYVETKRGAGVYVVEGLPEEVLQLETNLKKQQTKPPMLNRPRPFQPTNPDMRLFPHQQWAKSFQKIWTKPHRDLLAINDVLGYWPLRRQIAEHLRVWRGISCQAEQIIVTSGASEALALLADAFLRTDDVVAREDPGYGLLDRVLLRAQCKIKYVPVDDDGISFSHLSSLNPQPRCAIITPSRQFPLGMTMPLARRLQFLNWLENGDRFLIEDDYDSEYRYSGTPLPALLSLAPAAPVIYLGSFSKVFSKSLRLGYIVVPNRFLSKMENAAKKNQTSAAFLAQPVLARFMQTGAYASHIRRMRRIYSSRQKALVSNSAKYLSGLITFSPSSGGMHLVGKIGPKLTGQLSDTQIADLAAQSGITLHPLSGYYHAGCENQGLIAGYAGFDEIEIVAAIQKLATCLSPFATSR